MKKHKKARLISREAQLMSGWVGQTVRHKRTGLIGKVAWEGRDFNEDLVIRTAEVDIIIRHESEFERPEEEYDWRREQDDD